MSGELGERYLKAIEGGDAAEVLALFTDDAVVVSPLYGEAPAKAFYPVLLGDTRRAAFEVVDVFASTRDPRSLAVRTRSRWTLSSGFSAEIDGVHLLGLDATGEKIAALNVLYDTAAVRETFNAMKGLWGAGSVLEQSERARVLEALLDPSELEKPAGSV
jgi:ketosteroid isomerase-like protein